MSHWPWVAPDGSLGHIEIKLDDPRGRRPAEHVAYGAGPDGGLNDVESFYGGRAAGNPEDAEATSPGKFYRDGTRPDHMLFASSADDKAAAQKPAILCPNCGTAVRGLNGAKERYPLPADVVGFPPEEALERVDLLVYQLHPCGCRVGQHWAAAYTREMNRRRDGLPPGPVQDFSAKERDAVVAKLEARITDLYSAKAAALVNKDGDKLRAAEFSLVVTVDQLMRLVPGAHNRLPGGAGVSPEVTKWARDNKLAWPGADDFGYPPDYPFPKKAGQPDRLPNGLRELQQQQAVADKKAYTDTLMRLVHPLDFLPVEASTEHKQELLDQSNNIALQLQQMSGAKRKSYLDILATTSPQLYAVVQARLLQPAPGARPASGGDTVLDSVKKAVYMLQNHLPFCAMLVNHSVRVGIGSAAALRECPVVLRSLEDFLAHGKPMSDDAARFVTVLATTGAIPTHPGQPRAAAAVVEVAGPVAVDPALVRVNRAAARADRERFMRQFERPRRKVRRITPKGD